MKLRRLTGVLLGVGFGWYWSAIASAQTAIVTPSLTLGEEYDDNVRLTPTNRQSDFTTTVTPGLRLEVKDHPWYVTLAASLRGEFFATRSELNNFADNGSGTGTIEFRPTSLLTARLTDTFVRSVIPLEIGPATGLPIIGRSVSTNNTAAQAMSYRISPLTSLNLQYSLGTFRSDSPGARNSDTHAAEFSMQHDLTLRDSATFRYTFNRFEVEGSPDVDTHLPKVGVSHAFSPAIRVTAEAGPLLRETAQGEEVSWGGTLRYEQQFRLGAFSVSYNRAAGLAGTIGSPGITQSVTTTTNFPLTSTMTLALNSVFSDTESSARPSDLQVFTNGLAINYQPLRLLSMNLQFAASDSRSPDRTVNFSTYSGAFQLNYRLLRWLSLQGGYRFQRQDDMVGPNDLARNVFFLNLAATDQFRAY